MGTEEEYIVVKTKIFPTFYQDFACIMDRCQYNCCTGGWRILFSKKDYLKIKRAEKIPEVEEITKKAVRRLPNGKRTEEAYAELINTPDVPCLYQDEKGLCLLQLTCGEDTLPKVCQMFPRSIQNSAMGKFYTLSTACEAVVELLWNLPQGIDFVEDALPRNEIFYTKRTREFDLQPLFISTTIDILQARSFTVSQRLLLLGMVLQDVKNTGFADLQEEQWKKKVDMLLEHPEMLQGLETNTQNGHIALIQQYEHMRNLMLNKYWDKLFLRFSSLQKTEEHKLKTVLNLPLYLQCKEQMDSYFGDIEYFWENILVNLCFWMQIPWIESEKKLWQSYINLCNIYSFFRVASVMACDMEPTKEKLFQSIVMCSRVLLHDRSRMDQWTNNFQTTGSESLAHMALLVQL